MSKTCTSVGAKSWSRCVYLLLLGWVVAVGGLHAAGVAEPVALRPVVNFLAADAFLIGAVLRLFRWHSTRDPGHLRQAIGLTVASVLFPVTAALAPWTTDGLHLTPAGVLIRAAVLVAILPLVTIGPGWPARPAAVAFLVAYVVLRLAGPNPPGGVDGLAPGFLLAAALLLAAAPLADFWTSLRANARHEDGLELQLATAQARLEAAHRAQRERLHDARSAVAGVLGASTVLSDEHVPFADRAALPRLIADEVSRLAAVLGMEPTEPIGAFDLPAALLPVLRLHRLTAAGLTWELPVTGAIGRPRATATALDNLLANARTHAPGARVRVVTRLRDGVVDIVVDDEGPGIPPAERETVLRPGVRGSGTTAPGSGLGLANVVAVMENQHGHVEVTEAPSGGARVMLSLPALVPATVAS